MTFSVDLRLVQKTLDRMDPTIRKRVIRAVRSLAHDPRPPGAIKLEGCPGVLRVRVGDCRILYTIEDDRMIVLVVKIGHRSEVYR